MSKLVILNRRPFVYEAEFAKKTFLFRSDIGIFDIFFKRLCKEGLENLQ